MRISDWSSDVCSSDLPVIRQHVLFGYLFDFTLEVTKGKGDATFDRQPLDGDPEDRLAPAMLACDLVKTTFDPARKIEILLVDRQYPPVLDHGLVRPFVQGHLNPQNHLPAPPDPLHQAAIVDTT